jgi:hypothetical protein
MAIPINSIEPIDRIEEEVNDQPVLEISVSRNNYAIVAYETFTEVINKTETIP